jgi:hypothetical protein
MGGRMNSNICKLRLDLLFACSLLDDLGTTQADTMIRAKFERKLAGFEFAHVVKH